MRVQIFSLMAATLKAEDGCMWEGEVPISEHDEIYSAAEQIFRFFNRVDEADEDRLNDLDYHLPSLSVGDIVWYGGNAYQVANVGFAKLTDTAEGRALVLRAHTNL